MAFDFLRKYKARLELLEQLYGEGKVSEQTYRKVRGELISRVVHELRLRERTPGQVWVEEAKPRGFLKSSRSFSSMLRVPTRIIDEHFLVRLPSSFHVTLSSSSLLFLGIAYVTVIIGIYLMLPFIYLMLPFIFAMLGSFLLALQVKIDQRAGYILFRPRMLQKFIMWCSEVPSTSFIINFMIFLMLAALALAMASPTGIADALAVYAFYFLVIGVGIQLIDVMLARK